MPSERDVMNCTNGDGSADFGTVRNLSKTSILQHDVTKIVMGERVSGTLKRTDAYMPTSAFT